MPSTGSLDGVSEGRSDTPVASAGAPGLDDWRGLPSSIDWQCVRGELGLSLRELEVVQHIFDGKKLSTIADDMQLALGTVKTYCQRIHRKLGVADQRELTLAVLNAHLSLANISG